MPTDEERRNAVYAWYNNHWDATGSDLKHLDHRVIARFDGVKDRVVLNIGAHVGDDEERYAPEAREWHALDPIPEVIRRGRLRVPQAHWHEATASVLPFTDGYFDVVLSLSTLDHVPNLDERVQAHKEAARVLKHEGLYILVSSNRLNGNPPHIDGPFGYERTHLLGELVAEVLPSGLMLIHSEPLQNAFSMRHATVWLKGSEPPARWKGRLE